MPGWEVVPEEEVPKLIEALERHLCVVCGVPVSRDCGGDHYFYCHEHDDGCSGVQIAEAEDLGAK